MKKCLVLLLSNSAVTITGPMCVCLNYSSCYKPAVIMQYFKNMNTSGILAIFRAELSNSFPKLLN